MSKYNDITIHQTLSASTQERRVLLSCGGRYYEASPAIAELVEELQSHDTEGEAIAAYVEKKAGKYTPEQVRQIIDKFITPLFAPTETKRSFLYEKELFTAQAIDRFSDRFSFLFHKVYMSVVLALALVGDIYFFWYTPDLFLFNNKVNVYLVIGLFVFMLASSFFHELGHASACKYFGVRHGGVGFGLYLTFPVLYTDVTEIWKLNRRQRCVVNLAGIYFQSIILLPVLVAYFVTGHPVLKYLILLTNINFVITLNPFFRFDGYWLMTDLLGIANLRAKSMELLRYLYYRMCGKAPDGWKPALLMVKPAYRYALFAYSVVVNLFFGYYFFYIIPLFIIHFVESFPGLFRTLLASLSSGTMPDFGIIQQIVAQLLFMAITVYFLYRMVKPLTKIIKWKKAPDKS